MMIMLLNSDAKSRKHTGGNHFSASTCDEDVSRAIEMLIETWTPNTVI